jgi:CBS domain-containing protein
MSVRTLYNPNVATIDNDADVRQAAVLMRQEHVGDLVVTQLRDGHTLPVGVTIRRSLVTVHEDSGVEHALHEMRGAGVRRAPVVNDKGELVGLLSIDDVIDHLAAQLADIAATIRHQQEVESRQLP